jgi:NTE family protein
MSRALVLGAGGPVGVAWQSGLLAGFAQAGVDFGLAEFILGTSAGSIVGARLASGVAADRLADAALDPASTRLHPPVGGSPDVLAKMIGIMNEARQGARNPAEARREVGALALSAATASEADVLAVIGQELAGAPHRGWPARDFACTAVDAQDGGFQLWRADSGADLLPAVAASCSIPGLLPPTTVNGRRYMDGGMRSLTNADLAAGYDVVVVVSAFPPGAERFGAQLDEEVESLQGGGSTVVVVSPDDGSLAAMGSDLMDAARKPDAARAAIAQAASQAQVLKGIWG